jgi:YHS domain-containing protein
LRCVLIFFTLLAGSHALAAGRINTDAAGVALHGYDPVAYFSAGKPAKGNPGLAAMHDGATYHFASEASRVAFQTDPQRYLPQNGGYCAYGVAQGAKPDIDPTAFAVADGKLYLNLSPAVQKRWSKDIPSYIKAADANWKNLARQ